MRNENDSSLQAELADSPWLIQLAAALVGRDAAEDLVQDAMLERLRHPSEPERPRAFLATIVRRLAWRRQRGEQRRRERESEAERRHADVLDDAAERGRRLSLLWREIEELAPETRSLLVLRFVDGLEAQHIARRLDISPNAARVRVHRALDELRDRLDARHGGRREDWLRALAPLVLGPAALRAPVEIASSKVVTKGAALVAVKKKTLILACIGFALLIGIVLVDPFSSGIEEELQEGSETTRTREYAREPRRTLSTATSSSRPHDDREATEDEPTEREVLVYGRVVDDRRRPVEGAEVTWRSSLDEIQTTHSDVEGLFTFKDFRRHDPRFSRQALVSARDVQGRVGLKALRLDGQAYADGLEIVLVLEEARVLPIVVRDAGGALAAGAEVLVRDGEGLPIFRGRCDDVGALRIDTLSEGSLRLLAWQGDESAVAILTQEAIEGETIPVQMRKGRTYRFRVVDEDGRPIPDVSLKLGRNDAEVGNYQLDPRVFPRSNALGEIVVRGIQADERAALIFEARGLETDEHLMLEPGGPATREIVMRPRREWSWRLVDGEVTVPADGVTLVVRSERLEAGATGDAALSAEISGGELRLSGRLPRGGVLVRTPEGHIARLQTEGLFGPAGEVAFHRPRRLDLRVSKGDAAEAGVGVQIRTPDGHPVRPTAETDEDGRRRFEGLFPGEYEIVVGRPGEMADAGHLAARVDLREESKEIEVRIGGDLVLDLNLQISGRPAIPGDYDLTLEGAQIVTRAEFPESGRIVVSYRPGDAQTTHRLRLQAKGFQTTELDIDALPDQSLDLALVPTTLLQARVILPPDGQSLLELMHWDEDRKDWVLEPNWLVGPKRQGVMTVDIRDLQAGRYRVRDSSSRSWSPEVRIVPGQTEAQVQLDLSRVTTITVEVRAPEGYSAEGTLVRTVGDHVDTSSGWSQFGRRVDREGRVELKVDLAQDVWLIAKHPRLLTTPRSRAPRVDRNREIQIIELTPGPTLRARLPEDISPLSRLHVFEAGALDEVIHFQSLKGVKGDFELTALQIGRYDLMFDCAPYAPLVIRGVELTDEGIDLGTLDFDAGITLTVELDVPAGTKHPEVYIIGTSKSQPRYVRFANSGDENPIKIEGFAPGLHSIRIKGQNVPVDQRAIEMDFKEGDRPVLRFP